jgi:flagellar biosynthetic protein FliS
MASPFETYRTNHVLNAAPGVRVALLLETAARHLQRAREAIVAGDIEGRFAATQRATTILSGLCQCLDRGLAEGREVIETLDAYYRGLIVMVAAIDLRNDPAACDPVIESLRTMADCWREVQRRANDELRRPMPAVVASLGDGLRA